MENELPSPVLPRMRTASEPLASAQRQCAWSAAWSGAMSAVNGVGAAETTPLKMFDVSAMVGSLQDVSFASRRRSAATATGERGPSAPGPS